MTEIRTTIGIDVSKDSLDCYVMPTGKSRRFANSSTGIITCINWICKNSKVYRVVFEPTGGYERRLLKALLEAGLPASRVNAFSVQHFRKSKNDKAKTDVIDAEILAHYGLAMEPELTKAISPIIEELGELVHRRRCLKKQCSGESTRLEKTTSKTCLASIQKIISYLKQEIREIEIDIKRHLKHSELETKAALLMKNKGISHITAATLLAELPELGEISREKISRLMGVAPMNKDSGKSNGQRCIRGGRKETRNTWYMATLAAVRSSPPLRKFFLRKRKEGKPHKVAMVAAMRKFLICVNSQMYRLIQGQEYYIESV